MSGDVLSTYLDKHAEAEARHAHELPIEASNVVAIPCCGEGDAILRVLESLPASEPSLAVVTVNARADAPGWVHQANRITFEKLKQTYGPPVPRGNMQLYSAPFGPLLTIDRTPAHAPIPRKQGVGLARKVGADVGTALIARGHIRSSWIHCTDADALLPRDYFHKQRPVQGAAAMVLPFEHEPANDPLQNTAITLYELHLRYYVLGLASAGSLYAFHTIGSTMALNVRAYAAARGFPLREAAEDFYMLSKLGKLGCVAVTQGEALRLSPRPSCRVPFGTGRAVRDWMDRGAPPEQYFVYHPDTFPLLGRVLQAAEAKLEDTGLDWMQRLSASIDAAGLGTHLRAVRKACEKSKLHSALERAVHSSNSHTARRRSFHTYFDSFRTLKWVHSLRDAGLQPQPLREALCKAAFAGPVDPTSPMHHLLEQLRQAEQARPPARQRASWGVWITPPDPCSS